MLGNQRDAVPRVDQDVAVGIGGAVGWRVYDKARLEGSLDEAIRQAPVQTALLAAERQIKPLATCVADIVEVAGIDARGDELDVIGVERAEHIGAPDQALSGQVTAQLGPTRSSCPLTPHRTS